MQMIERIVAGLIERIRGRLGDAPKELQDLERECERVMGDEFAELHARVRNLTSASAADVIRPVERLRAYAMLLAAQVLLQDRRRQVDPSRAPDADALASDARRALELLLEAVLAGRVTQTDRTLCPELFGLIDAGALAPRYLEALVTVGDSDANDTG